VRPFSSQMRNRCLRQMLSPATHHWYVRRKFVLGICFAKAGLVCSVPRWRILACQGGMDPLGPFFLARYSLRPEQGAVVRASYSFREHPICAFSMRPTQPAVTSTWTCGLRKTPLQFTTTSIGIAPSETFFRPA